MRTHDRNAIPIISAFYQAGIIKAGQVKRILFEIQKNIDRREEAILKDLYNEIAAMEQAQVEPHPEAPADAPGETGRYIQPPPLGGTQKVTPKPAAPAAAPPAQAKSKPAGGQGNESKNPTGSDAPKPAKGA